LGIFAVPIYVYRCSHCGHAQDVLQKMSDPHLHTCPSCGRDTYEKQVTAASFRLKGTGWYETDFRDSKKAPAHVGAAGDGSGAHTAHATPAAHTAPAAPSQGKPDARSTHGTSPAPSVQGASPAGSAPAATSA